MRCLQGIRCGFAVFVPPPPYAPLAMALVFLANKSVINKEETILHFHTDHNAPCLSYLVFLLWSMRK